MKIGRVVDAVPPSRQGSRDYGKYGEIYKRVDRLKDGQWLPVQFNTVKEAYNFRLAVETHRTRLMDGRQRKTTVYVRNKVS